MKHEEIYPMVDKMLSKKDSITDFKNLAVKHNQYDLAAALRDLERKHFPKRKQNSKEHIIARNIEVCLRMTDLKVDLKAAFIIHEVVRCYAKMKGKFDMKMASDINTLADECFG